MKPRDIFTDYYKSNFWGDPDSVSGPGSNLAATKAIRDVLPTLFAQLGITSLLDIPCGDFYWFSQMWSENRKQASEDNLGLHYIGGDIVRQIVFDNREHYVHPLLQFEVLDATRDLLPRTDMILCRDLLGHLNNAEVQASIRNFKRSGAHWLLATTFPHHDNGNGNISTGQWRPLNLSDWRLGLGEPKLVIDERQTGKFNDKHLGLWELKDD